MSKTCTVCGPRKRSHLPEAGEEVIEFCPRHQAESLAQSNGIPEINGRTLVNLACQFTRKSSQLVYDHLIKDSRIIQEGSEIIAAKFERISDIPVVKNGANIVMDNAAAIANSDLVIVGSRLIMEDVQKIKRETRRMIHIGAKRICDATADRIEETVRRVSDSSEEGGYDDDGCVMIR